MANGPSIIYDKSLLQSLNLDESFWLGMHYRTNLTPLFFVEVVADLRKPPPDGKTPEDVVRHLAHKVGQLGTTPNVHHAQLTIGDLLGDHFPLKGIPLVSGGQRVMMPDGTVGEVIREAPEQAAFNRWRDHDFHTVDRVYAAEWRAQLAELDLSKIASALTGGITVRFSNLDQIKATVDKCLTPRSGRFTLLRAALELLNVPAELHQRIVNRWKSENGPPFHLFAPYAHYKLSVDLFFGFAVASGHIAATRPTNQVDIAYLYYLPFCNVFSSFDKLHKKTAPLFMREDQVFVPGNEMKADLAALVGYYDALPDEMKTRGAMHYASYPPLAGKYLTCDLHDRFLPG